MPTKKKRATTPAIPKETRTAGSGLGAGSASDFSFLIAGICASSRSGVIFQRCANFAHRWDMDPNLLDAQIPAIRKLKSLADPSPKPEPAVLVSLGVAGAVALFFLMGILAGLTSVGYHLIGGR